MAFLIMRNWGCTIIESYSGRIGAKLEVYVGLRVIFIYFSFTKFIYTTPRSDVLFFSNIGILIKLFKNFTKRASGSYATLPLY